MRYSALAAIRDRLKNDPALTAFFQAHYGAGHFFIGAKLQPSAADFPYVAVAPMQEAKPLRPSIERQQQISILFGVNEKTETDGAYIGIERICELGELILAALDKQPLVLNPAIVWNGEAKTRSDAGVQHPFYEGEILITILTRG